MLWRGVLKAGLILLAVLGGCRGGWTDPRFMDQPDYGMMPPPGPPHDPAVLLESFEYFPPSPIRIGDTLQFTAVTNLPTDDGYMGVVVKESIDNYFNAPLRDDGLAPDDVAADGVWRGELSWTPQMGTLNKAYVTLYLHWYDFTEGQELAGPRVTVLEEAQ